MPDVHHLPLLHFNALVHLLETVQEPSPLVQKFEALHALLLVQISVEVHLLPSVHALPTVQDEAAVQPLPSVQASASVHISLLVHLAPRELQPAPCVQLPPKVQ